MSYRSVMVFAKVMSPGRLMAPMMKKCFEKDFQALKTVAESENVPAAPNGTALA